MYTCSPPAGRGAPGMSIHGSSVSARTLLFLAALVAAGVVLLGALDGEHHGGHAQPRPAALTARGAAGAGAQPDRERHRADAADRLAGLPDLPGAVPRGGRLRRARRRPRPSWQQVQGELAQERSGSPCCAISSRRRAARLSRQLVSSYESAKPDLMSVVLNAHGFNDLLDQLELPRAGRAPAAVGHLRRADRQAAGDAGGACGWPSSSAPIARSPQTTEIRVRALAGMNELLQSKQSALASARDAQQSALAASRARGSDLRHQISHVEAQQAAAERAARQALTPPAAPIRSEPPAAAAAGRSPTRSCCASPAARTTRPTAPARLATTRSSRAPGSCSAAPARPRTWPPRPSRTSWPPGSGGAAPARRTGSAPASSGSTEPQPRRDKLLAAAILLAALAVRVGLRRAHAVQGRQRRRDLQPAGLERRADRRLRHGLAARVGRGRLAGSDRLLPARASPTSWRSPTSSTATSPATSPR